MLAPACRYPKSAAAPPGRRSAPLFALVAALSCALQSTSPAAAAVLAAPAKATPAQAAPIGAARSFNFENDITPLLSRFSCNNSGCHGKAEGQNGFKLSVFGFDPQADYDALLKEGRGRRIALSRPDASLLLGKASGRIPHGGGNRILPGTREYQVLRDWIAAGAPLGSSDDPKVASIRLEPREALLKPKATQTLRVTARYTDGREEDVTALARFQSNNEAIAQVDETGLIQIGDVAGQAAVMAAYNGAVDVFNALVPQQENTASQPKLPASAASHSAERRNFIDDLVDAKLAKLNIVPSGPCDDATYLRRVTLDLIGTLPTADEAREFLADNRPDKRERWVASLFDRPEFADFWALQWADLLRVDRQVLGHKQARDYYEWIRTSVAVNKPLDVFATELLTADGPLAEQPQGAFYRVVTRPGDMAGTFSQVFLGIRIACAECHHHPHDRWSQTDYYGMTAYFAQVRQKVSPRGLSYVAMGDPETKHPRTGEVVPPHALGEKLPAPPIEAAGATPATKPAKREPTDRRVELARWMTGADNAWFARNAANRLWAHLLGRGLVEPVDDVRATNPPSNPELLAALAEHLVEHRYDTRELMRTIVSSATYQRSTEPVAGNERDEQNYSRALLKRPSAEVMLDAVCQTTGVPEKFSGTPAGSRAVELWDNKTAHYFLRLFGRPNRTTACSCERSVAPNVAQVLHLMNSPTVQQKLQHTGGRIAELVRTQADEGKLVDEMYLTFFTRYPSDTERQAAVAYLNRPNTTRLDAAQDLAWSLLNTLEFSFNH